MTDADNLLADHDIAATNVRPAFEASLRFGATERELAATVGWERNQLEADGASVSGASTYAHMELMFGKPNYPQFVLAATSLHTPSSLGVVGLACKTVATVGEALACHQRFQHLTNRSARYRAMRGDDQLTIEETREGEPRLGLRLVSDYAMFIALQLLRSAAAAPIVLRSMQSRRVEMEAEERRTYENFLGAPIRLGGEHATLAFDIDLVSAPVAAADAEVAEYFRSVLERAAPPVAHEDLLLRQLRATIGEALMQGTPTVDRVARTLGLGPRTLQRRLSERDMSFAEVLDSCRRSLAEGYLADPSLSLAEIAYLLGFSEQTSFFRAFRRWHGTTPGAFRQALTRTGRP